MSKPKSETLRLCSMLLIVSAMSACATKPAVIYQCPPLPAALDKPAAKLKTMQTVPRSSAPSPKTLKPVKAS